MKKRNYKSLILFVLMGLSIAAHSQNTKFQRLIGGTGDDRSYSMAQTKDGGYILTGYTKSFGTGGSDIYLTKTDGLGKVSWSKTYGTSGDEIGWKVRQTSDSGYVVVGTASGNKGNGVFFKTDANGVMKWGKIFKSDSAEDVYNVIESKTGAFYVTGFIKTDSFGTDAFLAKYTSAGNISWATKFGAAGNEEGYSIVEETNGNIGVVGLLINDTITFGGKNGLSKDEDILIARFNPNGGLMWLKNFGTFTKDQAWDIKYKNGNYVITGWTHSESIDGDALMAIIDTSGNVTNASLFTSLSGSSKAFSIIVNPDDTYSLTGYTKTVTKGQEAFYINTSPSGNVISSKLLGGSSTDGHWPSEVVRTIDGGFTIFTSSNSFKTNNSYDLYLVRMDANGVVDCNQDNAIFSVKNAILQSGNFGSVRYGFPDNTLSLTTKTITTTSDSVLCCKLQAQVAASSVDICKGESVRLGKPIIPGYVYKWTEVGGSFTSNQESPLVTPAANTTYKLVVSSSDGLCKKDSATIAINIRSVLKNTDFVRDTFFCAGDSVHIKARSGAIDYKWLGKKTNLSGQNVVLFQDDIIVLTITDVTTCTYKDTMKVTLKNLPVFSLGSDTTICDNTTLTLKGPAKMKTYLWNGGQGKNQTFTTNEERNHTLSVIDTFGCKFTDSKYLFNNPAGGPFSLGRDTAICKGIDYTINGWGALSNYFWDGKSVFNPNLIVKDAGTHTFQAQNNFGCIHRDTIVIKLKSSPTFSLGADGGVCATGGRTLKGPAARYYLWSDASTSQNLQVFFAGTYWLKVTDTTKANGCIFSDTIKLTIVQNPKPELGADTTINPCDSIILNPGTFVTYLWSTGATTQTIKVKTANLYSVKVTDINTCMGEDDKSVKKQPCNGAVNGLKIPGLKVQPNPANSNINIEWLANGKGASITLFDIHGKKVFEQQAAPGLGQYSIDVNQWARGIYYLKVSTNDASQTIKVILE